MSANEAKRVLSIGSESVQIDDKSPVIKSELLSLRYDPTKLQPVMISPEMFDQIAIALDAPQLTQRPDMEKETKLYHRYQREAGQLLGLILHKIITNPKLTTEGVLVKFPAKVETQAPAQAPAEVKQETTSTQQAKGKK